MTIKITISAALCQRLLKATSKFDPENCHMLEENNHIRTVGMIANDVICVVLDTGDQATDDASTMETFILDELISDEELKEFEADY